MSASTSHQKSEHVSHERDTAKGELRKDHEGEKRADLTGVAKSKLARVVRVDGRRALHFLKKKPTVGAAIAGSVGFAAASVFGVGELAIAMAAGYADYRALTT